MNFKQFIEAQEPHPSVLEKVRRMSYSKARKWLKQFGLTKGEQSEILRQAKDYKVTEESTSLKILYVMRGLPGSGKSTLAKQIQDRQGGVIYSSDEFRYVNGKYVFDPKTDIINHEKNIKRSVEAIKKGISPIIIDNVNVKFEHAEPYIKEALANGYKVSVVNANAPWAQEAVYLTAKNIHNVPLDTIRTMMNAWEPNVTFLQKINEL